MLLEESVRLRFKSLLLKTFVDDEKFIRAGDEGRTVGRTLVVLVVAEEEEEQEEEERELKDWVTNGKLKPAIFDADGTGEQLLLLLLLAIDDDDTVELRKEKSVDFGKEPPFNTELFICDIWE